METTRGIALTPALSARTYRLTDLQRSMVLALQSAPQSGAYVLQDVCEFDEDVDSSVLRAAWKFLAVRHPALRLRISISGAEPEQSFEQPAQPEWREYDWTALSTDDAHARMTAFLEDDRRRGFVFSEGVPLRFAVFRNPGGTTTLVWTIHHALVDGRSLLIAWREWLGLYDALLRGHTGQLGPAKNFEEHLLWLEQQDFHTAENYWREYFDSVSQTTEYIIDRAHAARGPHNDSTGKENISLPEYLTTDLKSFAARAGVTMHTLVQGAWALLLSRYCGRRDVIFGVTRAGRSSSENDGLVGPLINTLPFRVVVDENATVLNWLRQIRTEWGAQREHQHTPLSKLRKWSTLPAGTPLFESVLVYDHDTVQESLKKTGSNWERRRIKRLQRTDSRLTLIGYGGRELRLEIAYATQLFSRRTIEAMLDHLRMLLTRFVSQADLMVGQISLLTESEERSVIQEFQGTRIEYPQRCGHELFEEQARRTPESVALDAGEFSYSYEEVNRAANRLARGLERRGTGEIVAVCMPRSPEAVMAILAVLKAGAAFLPIDPALPELRVAQMLSDSGVTSVVTTNGAIASLSSFQGAVINLDELRQETATEQDDNLPVRTGPEGAAYAIFTSGSTGKPKALVALHRGLVNHTHAAIRAFGIEPADRRLQSGPMGTDIFVAEIFNYLSCGATLVFGWNAQGSSMSEFLRFLEDRRITITGIPSTWWNEMVRAMLHGESLLPSSLRGVIAGMERVDAEMFQTWKRIVAGRIRWFNAYGPAEATLTSTIYEAGSSEWEGGDFVPIGKPHPNTQAYVLDEALRPVPPGVAGELYIGGAGVSREYLNAPELTAQRFVPDTISGRGGGRLYRTGDLVFQLPDGNLVFLGRLDRQVKIRGFRVELEEIEGVLSRHRDVAQCAVVQNERGGLTAYVSPFNGCVVDAGEGRNHLARYLPEHMIPSSFVMVASMPRTTSGKIDRQALMRESLMVSREVQPLSTETERRLASLWQRILKSTTVSADDDFFQAGGDSLSAVQLILLIRQEFARELPFAMLLQHRTVARLAAWLEDRPHSASDPRAAVIELRGHGSRPAIFCISPLPNDGLRFRGIAECLDRDQPVFSIPNPLSVGPISHTVEQLAARLCNSIQAVQPRGPYILCGYCFGGILAFEAALQLISNGEDVRHLVLIDVPTPGYPKLLRHRGRYASYLRELLAPSGRERTRVGLADVRAHLKFVGGLLKKKTAVHKDRMVRLIAPAIAESPVNDMNSLITQLARTYQPRPIATDISHFIAQEERVSARIMDDPRLGWRDFCEGQMRVYPVSAQHATLFLEEEAKELGELLESLLSLASDKSDGRGARLIS